MPVPRGAFSVSPHWFQAPLGSAPPYLRGEMNFRIRVHPVFFRGQPFLRFLLSCLPYRLSPSCIRVLSVFHPWLGGNGGLDGVCNVG